MCMREWTGRTSPVAPGSCQKGCYPTLLSSTVSDQGGWEKPTEGALNFLTLYQGGLGKRLAVEWGETGKGAGSLFQFQI